MNALEIKNLTKEYKNGFKAVDSISFSLKKGEFFGFLGPNGAGKTSTINCITGVGKISSGSISVMGYDVEKQYRDARMQIGVSPQEYNVDQFMPVGKLLWFISGYYGMDKAKRKEQTQKMLDLFELNDHVDKPFRTLSGGLKRRAMLGRAMIHDPEVLILDEPTAGVDVEVRREIWQYLEKINSEGKTILLTSHYLEEVEKLCTRIGVINGGKIVEIADKKEFLKDSTLEDRYLELTNNK